MTDGPGRKSSDLSCGGRGIVIWCLPIAILAATGYGNMAYRSVIWPVLLVWMGAACAINARRCRRRHCYATGPFFLALAPVSLLYGLGLISLGAHGWRTLTNVLLIGTLVLYCLPEWIWGRYVAAKRPGAAPPNPGP